MINDLRFALRQMVKNPGFTIVALFSLALGIGANVAIFSLLNSVLLSALPVPHPETLVMLTDPSSSGVGQGMEDGDRSLLDRTMIIYGSPMGDPNIHNHKRCPLIVLGGANGELPGNVHVRAQAGTPMANVMLTLMHKLGLAEVEQFGDSTGAFALT